MKLIYRTRYVIAFALFALVVILALILFRHWLAPSVVISSPVVIVPDTAITLHQPSAEPPRGLGRITRTVAPVMRRLTAGTPDSALARRYGEAVARAARWKQERDSLVRESKRTGKAAALPPEPPALLPPVTGTYDGRTLVLGLTRSNGSIMEATARVKPHWSFVAGRGGMSDTLPVLIQERWWLRSVRKAAHCALPTAVLAVVGAVADAEHRARGATVAGVATLVGCAVP